MPTGRDYLKEITPHLDEITGDVLFGDIWERPGLSKRDRSLITVASLIALNRPEVLPQHIRRGLNNGLSKDEISEVITHIAFYSGWPTAITAARIAKQVYDG